MLFYDKCSVCTTEVQLKLMLFCLHNQSKGESYLALYYQSVILPRFTKRLSRWILPSRLLSSEVLAPWEMANLSYAPSWSSLDTNVAAVVQLPAFGVVAHSARWANMRV
jgi:hypothetical protein